MFPQESDLITFSRGLTKHFSKGIFSSKIQPNLNPIPKITIYKLSYIRFLPKYSVSITSKSCSNLIAYQKETYTKEINMLADKFDHRHHRSHPQHHPVPAFFPDTCILFSLTSMFAGWFKDGFVSDRGMVVFSDEIVRNNAHKYLLGAHRISVAIDNFLGSAFRQEGQPDVLCWARVWWAHLVIFLRNMT
ncbi:hypothetical protein BC828DRAFT_145020 [Blastocladiella britannica]|nr:hypothetical protein BC828DRAFT_145020 [Blastocladiella britannica]